MTGKGVLVFLVLAPDIAKKLVNFGTHGGLVGTVMRSWAWLLWKYVVKQKPKVGRLALAEATRVFQKKTCRTRER